MSQELIPGYALPSRYDSDRNFFTEIYFLLEKGDFSAFHRLKSDEVWHFYTGSPITVHIIREDTNYSKCLMGSDLAAGHIFQLAIEKGSWFAAEVNSGSYSLVGCTVGPGFNYSDFELAKKEELAREFPEHAELISRLTR